LRGLQPCNCYGQGTPAYFADFFAISQVVLIIQPKFCTYRVVTRIQFPLLHFSAVDCLPQEATPMFKSPISSDTCIAVKHVIVSTAYYGIKYISLLPVRLKFLIIYYN
jgi:hypothetical protein